MLLKNAKIYTMEGPVLEQGYILIEGTDILAVGEGDYGPYSGEVLDLAGKCVVPGFVDAHCHLGMWEDALGFEGDDGNEDTDPVTPHLRAIDAINPQDPCFADAYRAGVTTVVTGPGSANVIGGQFAAINTYGRCIDEMILKAPAAMKFAFGENPKSVYNAKNQPPVTRMGMAAEIREMLFKAKRYGEDLANYQKDPEAFDRPEFDMKCESLLPVLDGSLLVKVHAHRADDMFTAMRIAREFGLSITLEHATEAHLISGYLAGMKLNLGPLLTDRSKPELKNASSETICMLKRAGIDAALTTDHPETPIEYLPLCAAVAVKHGLTIEEALAAITIIPARNVGIDGMVGSIKPGKHADLVVLDGPPLAMQTMAQLVFLNGKRIV